MTKRIMVLAIAIAALAVAAGCLELSVAVSEEGGEPADEPQQDESPQQKPPADEAEDPYEKPASEGKLEIYLPNDEGLWLEIQQVQAAEASAQTALSEWRALAAFLPPTEVAVEVSEDTAYVSFCAAVQDMDIDYEGLAVTGLVNTLTGLEGVTSVRVLVDGHKQYTLAGRSYIAEPLERDESLVARDDYLPLAPSDPRRGEQFIEGVVLSVDVSGGALSIDQFDADGSGEGRTITLTDSAVIHRQLENGETAHVTIDCIDEDDTVGIIMTSQGNARGVLIAAE